MSLANKQSHPRSGQKRRKNNSSGNEGLPVTGRKRTKTKLGKRTSGDNDNHDNDNDHNGESRDSSDWMGRCDVVWTRYSSLGKIGKGTYGVVYKARDKSKKKKTNNNDNDNEIVALKKCWNHHQDDHGFPVTTLREIQTLRQCRTCPSIVKLLNVAVSSTAVYLSLEYCPHDIAHLVDGHFSLFKRSPFQEQHVRRLMRQLLEALVFLHEQCGIIHRDLKLSNLLYTADGDLKLADFGLARPLRPSGMTPNVVSLWYRPPEVLIGTDSYDESVDVWGAGCVMAELILGQPISKASTEIDQLVTLTNMLGPLPPELVHKLPASLMSVQDEPNTDTRGGKTAISTGQNGSFLLHDLLDKLLSERGLRILLDRLLKILPSERSSASDLLREDGHGSVDQDTQQNHERTSHNNKGYFGSSCLDVRMPRFAA